MNTTAVCGPCAGDDHAHCDGTAWCEAISFPAFCDCFKDAHRMNPCEWCAEPTDEDGSDNACMIAHCLECAGRCNSCQDDMKEQADL